MDDLTRIKGIGTGSAKALAGAGIASFAALAGVDPAAPPEVAGLRSPDWAAWIAQAATLAATGADQGGTDPHTAPATMPPASTPEPTPATGTLLVTGPKRGRWRAGWHFGPEPVRLALADPTDEERAAIEADPTLTVEFEAEPEA
ncbi:helix-hairpin-helix domain-containing protein [Pararhodobacter zhoushanensis]|uniref:Helix-hairpin-helix domain-containing protein n=1 Tax=Pararhodobacter zhoushanensis TaxID=2479545 RepID=A0ABT3H2W2_9RHOB|nr:helix-hairpin-helix domain-containing protein [Pararhodobacter zhoushanensis]MCW1934117.1 helix-hairpin-helix domain-containing protein [Pararhodobacter zhoushanensis]